MKVSALKKRTANKELSRWVSDLAELPGISFKVRGLGCADDKLMIDEFVAAIPVAQRRRGLSADDEKKLMRIRLLGNEGGRPGVVADWHGWFDDSEQPIAFARKAAIELLDDPDIGDTVLNGMVSAATLVADEGRDSLEADAKN